jgi:hypothetical protein
MIAPLHTVHRSGHDSTIRLFCTFQGFRLTAARMRTIHSNRTNFVSKSIVVFYAAIQLRDIDCASSQNVENPRTVNMGRHNPP